MLSKTLRHIVTLYLLSTGACIEPYEFESEIPENSILVVDAQITDFAGSSYVELHFANPYSNKEVFKDTLPTPDAAVVYIKDQEGSVFLFAEQNRGYYTPADSLFAVLPGSQYQLNIELNDGRRYESDLIPVPEEVAINNIFWKYTEGHQDKSGSQMPPGYTIFVATDAKNKNINLKFSYLEIWEIENWGYQWYQTYKWYKEIYAELYGNEPFPEWPYDTLVPEICWQNFKPRRYLNINRSMQNSSTDELITELTFINNYDSRLKRRYAVEAEQISISDEAWQYWKNIEQQKAATGSLFDPVPYRIESNIYGTNSQDAEVAGFFVVGNMAKMRVIINSSEIPVKPVFYPECINYEIWAANPWGLGLDMGWPDLFADNSPCCFICDFCSNFSQKKPDWW